MGFLMVSFSPDSSFLGTKSVCWGCGESGMPMLRRDTKLFGLFADGPDRIQGTDAMRWC
jgi:hypothetical protein